MGVLDLSDSNSEYSKKMDEIVAREYYDIKSWDLFQDDVLMHCLANLSNAKPIKNFAYGVYVPTDFHFNVGQTLSSLCKAKGVLLHHLDCSESSIVHSISDFANIIATQPFSVILLENFDQVPDNLLLEKKYIENILIRGWESNFLTYRNRFLVLFTTTQGDGDSIPSLLKNIKSLVWCGNIRRYKDK